MINRKKKKKNPENSQTSRKTAFSGDETPWTFGRKDNRDTIVFRKQRYLSANTGHLLSHRRPPPARLPSRKCTFRSAVPNPRAPGYRGADRTTILSPHPGLGAEGRRRWGKGRVEGNAYTLRQRRRHPSSYRFLPEVYTSATHCRAATRRDNALSRRQLRTTFMLPRP